MSISLFDLYFPLPYRICTTILIGIVCWGINVQLLTAARIDVQTLIKYNHQNDARHPFHKSIYHFGTVLSIYVGISWLLFFVGVSTKDLDVKGPSQAIKLLDFVPIFTLFGFLFAFVLPYHTFHYNGRRRLLGIFKRIIFGGLDIDCRFADILIADVLTSYNKVLLDLVYTLFIFLAGKSSLTNPNRTYGGDLVAPITMAIPSLIRFRQCSIDFVRTGATIHILNCLKYASALPILMAALLLKRYKDVADEDSFFNEGTFFKIWSIACLINSIYSFYWDVTNDWGLELLSNFPVYRNHGLRPFRVVKSTLVYYLAVVIDVTLRAVWIMKLTYSWNTFPDLETGLFILEGLEISRRALWVFFRTEKEWTTSGAAMKEDDFELPIAERR